MLNLNISNVPGPRERGRVGGALVTEIYSVGPLTAGSGLNITVWSYVDQLNISVLSDGATVKDPHEVTEAMVADFIEIRRAAGISEELTVVEAAMAPASRPLARVTALGWCQWLLIGRYHGRTATHRRSCAAP